MESNAYNHAEKNSEYLSEHLFDDKEVAEKYKELLLNDAFSDGYKSKSYDIFLSYSHDDKEIVEKIACLLKEDGFSCWIDSDILRAGDQYNPIIMNAIANSSVFIAFLSKHYVYKKYCPLEFAWAQSKDTSIIAVTLDNVNEGTNKSAAYMFPYLCGNTDPGYGKTISTDDDAAFIANSLKESYQLRCMKAFYESGDPNDLPKIKIPEIVFSLFQEHNKRQYKQDGNYALSDIKGELFPAIKDIDAEKYYKDDADKESSLIKYINIEDGRCERRNLFLFGDGGMGKTVTLLKTAEYFLDNGIPAIYVPLSKISKEKSIEDYLRMNVCHGMNMYWRILHDTMSFSKSYAPSVVLLLDGVNELSSDREVARYITQKTKEKFIDEYKGVDLIITSRWVETEALSDLNNITTKLEIQQIDEPHINNYLESMKLPVVSNKKMLSVLSTPLFLSLYADVEKHKDKYKNIRDIRLIENPDTPGKILQNFFQTQLFRAAEEVNFDRASHYVLLDYMLPEIAYRMIKKPSNKMVLSGGEIWAVADETEKKCQRYCWYFNDRLRKVLRSNCRIDALTLVNLAERSLHFLHETEDGYEMHQSFRDYFVACHIKNEMSAFCADNNRKNDVSPVLEENCFNNDILNFVSDLVVEENAAPVKVCGGWDFHPENSLAEQLLDLWRNTEGEKAQNAVYNLFNIMHTGRHSHLFGCDFSQLDLRKCKLSGNIFVEWENDNIYPCKFDEAWIDYSSFVTDGHGAPVTALCTDGENLIFSGDENGNVKVFDFQTHKCKKTFELYSRAVRDLAWHSETKRLAIMYDNFIFLYSFENDSYEKKKNDSKSGDFRYVGFDQKGELTVAYSLEPLTVKYLSGEIAIPLPAEFTYDVPARCAKWNPKRTEFVRSSLFRSISVANLDEDGKFNIHPALKTNISDDNIISEQEQTEVRKAYEILSKNQKYYFKVFDSYHDIYDSYLINLENNLYIYNSKNHKTTHKISFNCNIIQVKKSQNQIIVDLGDITFLLKANLRLNGAYLKLTGKDAKNKNGVSALIYSEDGSRLLVGMQNQLFEFETEGFTIIRKKEFSRNIGAVCYFKDKIAVASGAVIYVIDNKFSEITVFDSSNHSKITHCLEDWNQNGCYILSNCGLIKKLNRELIVERVRKVDSSSAFTWARDKQNGKNVLLFSKMRDYQYGAAYNFENNTASNHFWKYEILERFYSEISENNYYPINNQIITYEKTPPFKKSSFKNYWGINIYECSFLNIRGDISNPEGLSFIHQNGGIINGK